MDFVEKVRHNRGAFFATTGLPDLSYNPTVPVPEMPYTIPAGLDGGSFIIATRFLKYLLWFAALPALFLVADCAADQDQSRFVLSGVITKQDGGSMALLGEPTLTQDRPLLVREGDQLGPYRVAKIREDRVELDGPSGKLVVRLFVSAGFGAPVTPSTPATTAAARASPAPTRPESTEPELKPGKEVREYLDAVMDPRIRNSGGFNRLLKP